MVVFGYTGRNIIKKEVTAYLPKFIGSVGSVSILFDHRIITGTEEGEINIWNPSTGEIDKTFSIHERSITKTAVLLQTVKLKYGI